MEKKQSSTLKEWAEADKPREKLLTKGKKELSDAELVTILLRSGAQGYSAMDMAKDILKDVDNNLAELARKDVEELKGTHKGLGETKAITLVAALELGIRMLSYLNQKPSMPAILDSTALYHYIAPSLIELHEEEFWVAYLDVKNHAFSKERISHGGLTETTVDLRSIFRNALARKANAIALCHNHPSGNLKPSRQDIELTKNIAEAGNILRIRVLDHLIVGVTANGEANFYSFLDNGLM